MRACAATPTGEAPQPVRASSLPGRPWQPQARQPRRLRSCSARNSAHDSLAWKSQSTLADLASSAAVAASDARRCRVGQDRGDAAHTVLPIVLPSVGCRESRSAFRSILFWCAMSTRTSTRMKTLIAARWSMRHCSSGRPHNNALRWNCSLRMNTKQIQRNGKRGRRCDVSRRVAGCDGADPASPSTYAYTPPRRDLVRLHTRPFRCAPASAGARRLRECAQRNSRRPHRDPDVLARTCGAHPRRYSRRSRECSLRQRPVLRRDHDD